MIDPTLTLISDSTRVKRVLTNLIENAFKFHRANLDNPYILIKASRTAGHGHVQVHVEDNGYGISSENQQRIFEMFYQATENPNGSGLGLFIVKEILQKLGGQIKVESKPGVGSTFIFSLPDLV
jgi:signal transduction histidine kinase